MNDNKTKHQKIRNVREIREGIFDHHEQLAETRRRMALMEEAVFDSMIVQHGAEFCLRLGGYALQKLTDER